MAQTQSANEPLLISRSAARSSVRDALRLYVGRGRRYSVKQLSNGTGVPDRLIESATCDPDSGDYRALCLEHLLSIAKFLGAVFTSEIIGLAGQGAFDLPEVDLPRPGEIAVDSSQCAAKTVEAAADGVIDLGERRDLKTVGQRDIARGMVLVKMAGRIG